MILRRRLRALRATSLIEVMVASVILIILLEALSLALSAGVRQAAHGRHVHEADGIAGAQLEQLIVAAANGPIGNGSHRYGADGREDADGYYRVRWVVEPERPVPFGARLRVFVNWNDGTERGISVQTYFVNDPTPAGTTGGGGRRRGRR